MKAGYLCVLFALGLGLALCLVYLLGSGSPVANAQGPDGHSTYYVAPSCTGVAEPCHTTVQDAVDAADDPGDVIKVATGVYTDINSRPAPAGHDGPSVITQAVYITKSITIRGGYTTTNGFADPPDPIANPTTLDAQGKGRGIYISQASSTTLAGLHITGGDAIGLAGGQWIYDSGGGVYVVSATATLSNNLVFGNIARDGGGVYVTNSAVTLSGNQVFGNTAGNSGGGICVINGDHYADEYDVGTTVTIVGNQVSSNTAGASGGGVYIQNDTFSVDSGSLTIDVTDNQVFSNTAGHDGGGMLIASGHPAHSSPCFVTLGGNTVATNRAESRGGGLLLGFVHPTLDGNTFISNSADYGGGLYLSFYNGGTYANTTIADNQANTAGSGLYILTSWPRLLHTTIAHNRGGDGSGVYVTWNPVGDIAPLSGVALTNTIIVSQTVGITMTEDIIGLPTMLDSVLWFGNGANTGGMGTISVTQAYTGDPAFVDPDNGDYHIGPDSAAIDRGVNAGVTVDIDGDPRPTGLGYDLGADEWSGSGLQVTKQATPDTVWPGAPLTYTIRITNATGLDLHATITDTLPLSVTLDEASGGTLALPGGTMVPPDGTVVLPDGRVAVTWTAVITQPAGVWMGTLLVTVDEGYVGPLTNLVEVTTEEGATGTYTHFTKPTPGLIIQGHVWRNHEGGLGLANVAIYRRFASYPGQLVATTDQDGYYESDFVYIPGDEMVTVWAELEGYTFRPDMYYWRHYYGHEVATLDFVANPRVYLPLILKQ